MLYQSVEEEHEKSFGLASLFFGGGSFAQEPTSGAHLLLCCDSPSTEPLAFFISPENFAWTNMPFLWDAEETFAARAIPVASRSRRTTASRSRAATLHEPQIFSRVLSACAVLICIFCRVVALSCGSETFAVRHLLLPAPWPARPLLPSIITSNCSPRIVWDAPTFAGVREITHYKAVLFLLPY